MATRYKLQQFDWTLSNAVNEIRNKVAAFEEEYQKSQSLEIGTEIN